MQKEIPQQAELDQLLASYSSGAKKLRGRIGNWPIYAAAAGSALAMATNASASVISGFYTGGGPNGGVFVQPQVGGASSVLGLVFGPGEINLKASSGSSGGPFGVLAVQGIDAIKIFQAGAFPNSQKAKNFAAGSGISAAAGILAATARIVGAFFSGSDFGSFVAGQAGYVGFALDIGGGNVEYGWLKVDFVKQGDIPYILEALAWGLELNPNQKINAGEMAAPEPGTLGLGILAAGAAGVAALRRRRKERVKAA